EYKDSLGNTNTLTLYRYSMYNNTWFNGYYPNDTLSAVTWKKWDCNVGYVHMGNLTTSDVNFMYSQLISTTAIIFDIRNYPKGTAWQLADLMYPNRICNGKFTEPNVAYPGTHFWYSSYLGINGNLSAYTGKVIILCNQQTQSHAEYTCMILRAMPNAVVVGSQTAGADGNITGFKFSQNISTGFTSLGCFYADGTETQKIGIVPDSFVYISPAGIRQSRDEVLEKALEIAGCIVSVNDNVDVKCELTIYPNPTSDNINISLSNAELSKMSISIFNSLGIEIKRFDEKELFGKNSISFSTESFPSGVYYCTMNNGTYKISKSFVVMR
nr:T9SS type A sorting domain-containing protein [Bacteroidota bacterium]